jgi:hypothetical protein
MLSATVGALDDGLVGAFESAPEIASPDFSQEGSGLPSGVSLLVCPVANWSGSGSVQLAPTHAIETNEPIEASGWFSSVIDDSGLLLCTFPQAAFSLSGDADFVSGDSEARVDATVEDTADGWVIWNFPADLAPPVPEMGVFAPPAGVVPICETFGDPDPTIIACLGGSADGDFGPADGWSYDGSVSAKDPTLEDGTEPVLNACNGYPLPREFCVLPMPVDFTSGDREELVDSGLSIDFRAYSTAVETAPQSPVPVGSPNTLSYSWMAVFAANVPGSGGESTQPATVRRRGR